MVYASAVCRLQAVVSTVAQVLELLLVVEYQVMFSVFFVLSDVLNCTSTHTPVVSHCRISYLLCHFIYTVYCSIIDDIYIVCMIEHL